MLKRLIDPSPLLFNCALLLLRIGTGCLMLTHGWPKLSGFSERLHNFADPIGLGSEVSFVLTVFAEFFCSIFLILGLFTRLAIIPMVITMLVVVFVVHINDPFGQQEKGLLYLFPLLAILLTGPGKYSIDSMITKS